MLCNWQRGGAQTAKSKIALTNFKIKKNYNVNLVNWTNLILYVYAIYRVTINVWLLIWCTPLFSLNIVVEYGWTPRPGQYRITDSRFSYVRGEKLALSRPLSIQNSTIFATTITKLGLRWLQYEKAPLTDSKTWISRNQLTLSKLHPIPDRPLACESPLAP